MIEPYERNTTMPDNRPMSDYVMGMNVGKTIGSDRMKNHVAIRMGTSKDPIERKILCDLLSELENIKPI